MKPHVKLASTLVIIGSGLIALERFGLSELSGNGTGTVHIDPTLLSVMVLAPVGLVLVGCVIFIAGTMRRGK